MFDLAFRKRWLLYFGCILSVVYVCVCYCPHRTWELVFGLGFRAEMLLYFGCVFTVVYVCVCLCSDVVF